MNARLASRGVKEFVIKKDPCSQDGSTKNRIMLRFWYDVYYTGEQNRVEVNRLDGQTVNTKDTIH
jgi:hypothetical protein